MTTQIIIFLIIIILLIIWYRMYHIKHDTVIAFTGGLGSGKSLVSTKRAIKLVTKNRNIVSRSNAFNFLKTKILKNYKYTKKLRPELYSSIPIFIKFIRPKHIKLISTNDLLLTQEQLNLKYELIEKYRNKGALSLELEEEHLLLRKKIIEKSVVFLDEIGGYASQWEYKNINVLDAFDEFIRLFRHYTKGGYFVCNDQSSDLIVKSVRSRVNQVFNLLHFKKFLFFFYTVKVRNMNISEEIKTIEEQDTEDNMTTLFGVINPFFRHYDTYCYSERYNTVPKSKDKVYLAYKKYNLMQISKEHKKKLVTNGCDTVGGGLE